MTRQYGDGSVYLRPAYIDGQGRQHEAVWVASLSKGTGKDRVRYKRYAGTEKQARLDLKDMQRWPAKKTRRLRDGWVFSLAEKLYGGDGWYWHPTWKEIEARRANRVTGPSRPRGRLSSNSRLIRF